jgi:uncharacterized protein (UPF0332 family)
MSFNWSDYLILAQNLAGKTSLPCQEAKLRSAISRAYYGAYCSTRNYLISKGCTIPKSGEAHKLVRDILLSKQGQLFRQIECDLDRLWGHRKNADYEDIFPGLLKTTTFDVFLAQRIIADLAKI